MRTIRASEIGEYVYCHRAWWLRHVLGHTSTNTRELAQGTALHAGHGRLTGAGALMRGLAIALLLAALVVAAASLLPGP